MYPNPSYQDGLKQVVSLSAYCYNNGATYTTYGGDPSQGAQVFEARNSDNQLDGSVTFVDGRKGVLNAQYSLTADELPGATNLLQPTFIVAFRQRFYVCGPVKTPIEKNQIIKLSAEITELMNPFIPNLLSVLGQQKSVVASALTERTQSCAGAGLRTGATVAYSAETFATEGSAAPTGITVDSTTGLLTIADTVAAGTYDVRVIVSDTVSLPDGTTDVRKGWGRYTINLT